jgi:hypothetical protein
MSRIVRPPKPHVTKVKGSVVQDGRLRYVAAGTTTIVAATSLGRFKLFKLMFGSDGSIYIPFPYLETKRGLLSEVDPASEPDAKTLDLRRGGVVVEYDAKFSHHTSGIARFSKSGEQAILPRRRSFPLTGPNGLVFDFRLFWLRGFEIIDRRAASKDLLIELSFDNHPTSLRVWGEWRTKADILASTVGTSASVGPRSLAVRRVDRARVPFIFLGQPRGFPLQDHVLMISATEIPHADGANTPTAIFMGGWDVHDGAGPATPKMLVFLYPFAGTA